MRGMFDSFPVCKLLESNFIYLLGNAFRKNGGLKMPLPPGATHTIASYNASAAKIYNAMSSLGSAF
jgi:hypothetical protein